MYIHISCQASCTNFPDSPSPLTLIDRSSKLHPVSSQSCSNVQAGRPTLARPCEGVQRSTSLMSSFLLLPEFPAWLARLIWRVLKIGSRSRIVAELWDFSSRICLIRLTVFLCNCCQAFSLYAQSASMWTIHRVVWARLLPKKLRFILSERSDLYITDSLLIAVHAFASRVFMSFSVDEMLLRRYVNLSTSFRESFFRFIYKVK